MDDAFRGRIKVIFERLRDLSAYGPWRNDLQTAFSHIEYSDLQLDAIKRSAATSFMEVYTSGAGTAILPTLKDELTHAFTDSVRNSAYCLEMVSDPQLQVEGDFALQVLTRARMGLRDIVNNYPLLLGEAMPGSVEDIIGVYRNEILPQMDDLIAELAEETGIDPDTVTPAESRQHLYALPPEVF